MYNPPYNASMPMMPGGGFTGHMPGWTAPPNAIQWIPMNNGNRPQYALQAGLDSGAELFVCRAYHNGGIVPGKLAVGHNSAYIAFGGAEIPKMDYEVLVAPIASLSWIDAHGGNIPAHAVPGGRDPTSGETSYIGRVWFNGTITVGKVQPSHGTCYFSYGGKEHSNPIYEILVRNALGRAMNV